MIRSKFQFSEMKISVRNIIKNSARNIHKDGTCLIYVEVIAFYKDGNKKTRQIPTDVHVNPKFWLSKKNNGTISEKEPEYFEKNLAVYKLFSSVVEQMYQREQGTWDADFRPENLKPLDDMFPKVPKAAKTLTDYIDDYIEYRRKDGAPHGTLKEFISCKNRLLAFEEFSKKKLYFDDMHISFSNDFGLWLKNVKTVKGGQMVNRYKSGTIEKTFTILRTILNHFYEIRDEQNINLSDKFQAKKFKKGTKSVNDPHPISRAEFNILKNHTFENPSLALTKKRFLFQCGTGMRYSDMFTINTKNIINDCIVYYPAKTIRKKDNEVEVPIMPLVRGILESVDFDMGQLKISNDKYNASLENMFNELNSKYDIDFPKYTSHDARDTFISYSLESGCDVPTLLKIVGQSSYDVMKRYFKSTPEKRIQMMRNVPEFN